MLWFLQRNPVQVPFNGGSGALTLAPAGRIACDSSDTWALAIEHYADYGGSRVSRRSPGNISHSSAFSTTTATLSALSLA